MKAFLQTLFVIAIAAGITLSVVSKLKLCSACSATANFSIFGMNFGLFGIAFFTLMLVAALLRGRNALAEILFLLLVFSAVGAETHFIWLQKYHIRQWCPICLSIAVSVMIAASTIIYEKIFYSKISGGEMKSLSKQMLIMVVGVVIGLSASIIGVTDNAIGSDVNPFLGKSGSSTTVYFVTDWFCPTCREVEPVIENIYPEISKTVKIGFVDFPIHKESLNFTPFNLQFLYFEKAKYMTLRKALGELALKTKKPTDEEVQAAVRPYGVKLRKVDYADILFGMQSDLSVYRGYSLKATPSVVVTNAKTNKTKILVGDKEITIEGIRTAINEVGKKE